MWAIVTGASAGIGQCIALQLAQKGYSLVLVARRADRLQQLATQITTSYGVDCRTLVLDVSTTAACRQLCDATADLPIEVLINNAGFGLCGEFLSLSTEKELEMIATNITAVHLLTKHFCQRFATQGKGYILNVASSAGFMAGPCMATYYATKNYVLRLTQAVREEQRRAKTGVHLCALCPGPVDTEFNAVAGVQFALGGLTAQAVAQQGLRGLFGGKGIVVPSLQMKLLVGASKLVPEWLLPRITYRIQHGKIGE